METRAHDHQVVKAFMPLYTVALSPEAPVNTIIESMQNNTEAIRVVESIGYTVTQLLPEEDANFPLLLDCDCDSARLLHSVERRTSSAQ